MEKDTTNNSAGVSASDDFSVKAPQLSLPKGGGAIKGIGEKFAANPVTGTGSMTVPIFTSQGRTGFGPQLSLSYDSGAGNGPFGFGWTLSIPSITRRTDRGLPHYDDLGESDIFILSGAEDLVPVLVEVDSHWQHSDFESPAHEAGFIVRRYRPRVEGLFARIERWTDKQSGISHWRSITKENITTLYGKRADARIADPNDATRVFSWLICESFDDKGNAVAYEYKHEDATNVDRSAPFERNRLSAEHFSQRYLKHIRYANRTPLETGEDLSKRSDWLFEVIFDYGEHDASSPTTREVLAWPTREDSFSLYRSTFDVRTYRLCRRVLMFHHFPDEFGGIQDLLVRSTDFDYQQSPIATFIKAVTQSGYSRQPDGSYFTKSLPKLEFSYTEVRVDETVRQLDAQSARNLPYGVDGAHYLWVDLDGEGLAGVLTEQANAWYYKRNLGNGTLGHAELVAPKPSLAALGRGRQHLQDINGDGHLELVQYGTTVAGYYSRTARGTWDRFTTFKSMPNIDTSDRNVRFIDVSGDGFADILVSEDNVFTWYESEGKDGFGIGRRTPMAWDEEQGPRLIFADPAQSIFVADMSGDGLADIVRIRHGEVCYWPNRGYGHFGAKVTMANAPAFDTPEQFDPKRVFLADIDGSGTTDIIYVSGQDVALYFNQSGNGWSKPRVLSHFPRVDSLSSIGVSDLLGNGTACLVWSSPLPSDQLCATRYIDLMGGQKPHLLVHVTNNMGAETNVEYAASTKFYLLDRLAGRPWLTKLPFPVHVIERLEHRDLVSNTMLVSHYHYSHGYYDGVEREFRGFAYVEQRDVETVGGEFDLPPVITKTWFHNGAFLEERTLEAHFRDPANREFFAGDPLAAPLPETDLPSGLGYVELREAARALKGSILRQEVYASDGSSKAAFPYSVSERSYRLKRLQPIGPNRHAVFFSHPSESIDYHYERNPADPRISHALTLDVDDYGNVLRSVAIGYPRRSPAFDEQSSVLATLTESQYTNAILQAQAYRTPLPFDVKTYELTAPRLKGASPLELAAVVAVANAAAEIVYESQATPGQTEKRLIEQLRTMFRRDDLSALLPTGALESMALPGESYKLALTPGLLGIFQSKASPSELESMLTGGEGGYRKLEGSQGLWLASGQTYYSPDSDDPAQRELAFAREHFFLPHRVQDPFGNSTVIHYDVKYKLVVISTRDAVGNEIAAQPDYRVLQATMVTDPNGNRTQARFDALGMVAGTAVMGKRDGVVEGDSFDEFSVDLSPSQIEDFFDAVNPLSRAVALLGTATTRVVYDLKRVPVCAASIARETHVSDLAPGLPSRVQPHFVYSDGFGREAQTKVQAEPGPLDLDDPSSPMLDPRWLATGTKVYNNKGKPVRQYEPFFSPTPQFGVEKTGVSSTLFYDPVERVVATLHPNHTYEKVVFDPWQQVTWDVNDTVTLEPATDPDVGDFFAKLPGTDYLPTWFQRRIDGALGAAEQSAADKARHHANTPAVAHLDTLGRTVATVADNGHDSNGYARKYRTVTLLDIEGNQRQVIDALDRVVMRYEYDMLSTRIHQTSMEAGERWMLNDVLGKPIRIWNSRNYTRRIEYDALRRPLRSFVQGGDPTEVRSTIFPQEVLFEYTIYGDSKDSGLPILVQKQANLRGKAYKHHDAAGATTTERYDFKGNLLRSSRQLLKDYRSTPDWSQNPALDREVFSSSTAYDALNRAVAKTAPDGSVYRPTFNEANLLEKVEVNLRGELRDNQRYFTPFVTNIDYNAKGQRTLIEYANGVQASYSYDADTFRLTHLKTRRFVTSAYPQTEKPESDAVDSQLFKHLAVVQDLRYTFDPVGNIARIEDAAVRAVFHGNQRAEPTSEYTYDPIYRLIEATGREHVIQSAFDFTPAGGDYRDYPFVGNRAHPNDLQALRNYTERYEYDAVGNFKTFAHRASAAGWTRRYDYEQDSLIEADRSSNRLTRTTIGDVPNYIEPYTHDMHGNMTSLSHVALMAWDFRDELQQADLGGGGTAYYVYDSAGQRVRKVLDSQGGVRQRERLYLDGFEVFREYSGNSDAPLLERLSLHVLDGKQRIALIETQTVAAGNTVDTPSPLLRFQFGDHLGSASIELDGSGALISYEEFHPFGTTAFQAGRTAIEVSLKRYRYTGKERDEETGFSFFGARYCVNWIARWLSPDPAELAEGTDVYVYGADNPIVFRDPNGAEIEAYNIAPGRPGNQPWAWFLGVAAHRLIAYHYTGQHLDEKQGIYTNYYTVAAILSGSGLGDPSKLTQSQRDLKPDIANATAREVFEIKPWNDEGLKAGRAQVKSYVDALNKGMTASYPFLKGIDEDGQLAVQFHGGKMVWRLTWKTTEPGIIQYKWQKTNKTDRDEIREAGEGQWVDITEQDAAAHGEEAAKEVDTSLGRRETLFKAMDITNLVQEAVGVFATAFIMSAIMSAQPRVPAGVPAPAPGIGRPIAPPPPPVVPPRLPPQAPPPWMVPPNAPPPTIHPPM